MKLLLDTHVLLWAVADSDRLGQDVRSLLLDASNDLYFSAASLLEVAIKSGLGRSDFSVDPHLLRRELLDSGYLELPVLAVHAAAVVDLPLHHKDPFDRLLVAQARFEGFVLLTADSAISAYGGSIMEI